ncbi:D-2-hydroxyacid dehydrogenase [Candidatus Arthromitus sp. SFB-rat-Yit]|uniref:D-2-hydroxyacid dehydrogenase n=1 Tax=Candidatus Arthromitus sp. SFB-rat-Yit TaxID=1041504 RepID=UPI000227A310|nr:D-2-hydroxyacid dehydrogenase [Candidatus Arthromitus sp. SFB-rat-Yit]BAK81450.1 D-isomer specific 2-hydroxyacid dehydrogenase NAD-binding protein [Candidatus Arthromitus sp. SFB-rat-Yit]
MDKVVVLDAYTINPGEFNWGVFLDYADRVEVHDRTQEDEVFERVKDATYVLTCKVPLRGEVLDRCKKLEYIGSMATGVDHIDIDFCSKNNITVTNVPDYSTNAVSELVFAYIFEYFRKVSLHNRRVHSGEWVKSKDFCFYDRRVSEIAGKTLGIFGYGNIGKKVSEIAVAFGMKVLVHTTTKREDTDNIKFVSKEELFKNSDILSLHCPLTNDTKHIINKETLSIMKDGVIIINTARGKLIDEQALKESLQNGKVGIAFLDVIEVEPMLESNVLLGVQNCVITPHYGWCPLETRERLFNQLRINLQEFSIHGNVINGVSYKS